MRQNKRTSKTKYTKPSNDNINTSINKPIHERQ